MKFKALKEIGLFELFSKLGKRVFIPQGRMF